MSVRLVLPCLCHLWILFLTVFSLSLLSVVVLARVLSLRFSDVEWLRAFYAAGLSLQQLCGGGGDRHFPSSPTPLCHAAARYVSCVSAQINPSHYLFIKYEHSVEFQLTFEETFIVNSKSLVLTGNNFESFFICDYNLKQLLLF